MEENNQNQQPTQQLVPVAPQVPAIPFEQKPIEVQKFELQQRAAKLFAMSGLFADIKGQSAEQSIAQAFVKISLGDSMGFTPAESMTGIDIIQGRVAIGASIRAARMQRAGYTWDVLQLDDKGCRLRLKFKGQPLMQEEIDGNTGDVREIPVVVSFTTEDAVRAGLLGKDNYKKNPRNMFFSRAITNAQRWFAPGILGADILDSDEAATLDAPGGGNVKVAAASQSKLEAVKAKIKGEAEVVVSGDANPQQASGQVQQSAPAPAEVQSQHRSRTRTRASSVPEVAVSSVETRPQEPAFVDDESLKMDWK